MSRTWTPAQRAAIECMDRSVIVSAAAGAGKTSVLTERIARLVCDADPPCDVDRLLVVTFTRDAALEMRGRIEAELRRRCAAAPDDARLQRQLALLDRAQISTLHGFCGELLRQHFALVGIDPAYRQLDEHEASLLAAETVNALFEDRYRAGDAEFLRLVDAYGGGEDADLRRKVLSLHAMRFSLADPEGWLDRCVETVAGDGEALLAEVGRMSASLLERVASELDRIAKRVAGTHGLEPYGAVASGWAALARKWAALDMDARAAAVTEHEWCRLPGVGNAVEGKKQTKARLDRLREVLKGEREGVLLRFTRQDWRQTLEAVRGPTGALAGLVRDFGRRFDAAKAAIPAVDFTDLEVQALRILSDPAQRGRPSAVARALRDRFEHVSVDEFQDINEVQSAIVRLVSREDDADRPANLFCVGDVKQSIYGFRLADPRVFIARERAMEREPSRGRAVRLPESFRALPSLMAAVNSVFERLMSAGAADLDYADGHGLKPPPGDGAADDPDAGVIELHVLDPKEAVDGPALDDATGDEGDDDEKSSEEDAAAELEKIEAEAQLVAWRVGRWLGLGDAPSTIVFGRDGAPRPAQAGDVAVLLRSIRKRAEVYAAALRRAGIRAVADQSSGFFDQAEVRDVLALLETLDNPRQDVPLCAVLRGPIAGIADADADEAMARLRLRDRARPFHALVLDGEDPAFAAVKRRLRAWRALIRQQPLAEALWSIYEQSGCLAFYECRDDGLQRRANLLRLHELARQFGGFARQGLGRFLEFLRDLREDRDLGQPPVAGDPEAAVRVMSIHRSKGLEFPLVVLAGVGTEFNTRDASESILADRPVGIGMKVIDTQRLISYVSLPYVAVQASARRAVLAEEMRLLYVAMTRARQRLVIVGSRGRFKSPTELRERWKGHVGVIPAEDVLACAAPLQWLSAAEGAGAALKSQTHAAPPELPSAASPGARARPWTPLPHAPRDAAVDDAMRLASLPYAHAALADIPATAPVSALEHASSDRPFAASAGASAPIDLAWPTDEGTALGAREIGSAMHVALRHLDFADAADAPAIRRQVEAMVARRLLFREAVEAVDVEALLWLARGEVGRRLRAPGATVLRELPVYLAADAGAGAAVDAADRVMLRGRVDALVVDADAALVLDYKTDRLTPENEGARIEQYSKQTGAYLRAVGAILRRAAAAWLVFLHARRIVDVTPRA